MGAPANARPALSRSSRALLRTNQAIQSRLAEMQMRLERLQSQVMTQREDLSAFDRRLGRVVDGGAETRSFNPSAVPPSAPLSAGSDKTAPFPVIEPLRISPLVVSATRQQHTGTRLLFDRCVMTLSYASCYSLIKQLRHLGRSIWRDTSPRGAGIHRYTVSLHATPKGHFCLPHIIISIRPIAFMGWPLRIMDNFVNLILCTAKLCTKICSTLVVHPLALVI